MELTQNNDLLQTVFDSASNGIAVMQSIVNNKGRVEDFSILLFNAYTLNWIGDIEYKGKRYGDVFPMVKETGILEKFIEVAETGITAKFERWYEGEGMRHWFYFTAVKHDDMLVVTTEDITERKITEIALRDSLEATKKQQRLYDSVTNTTPDLVYVFDLNYRFTYANKALLAMWGTTAEAAFGKGLRDLGYEEWHASMHESEIDEIIAVKKSIRGTVSFPHAELGERIYDYILAPVFNEQGQVEAIAGTTRDITEIKHAEQNLRQSESRLKLMIDQTPAPTLVLMGNNLLVEQINQPMLQMVGHGQEIIGSPLIENMPELEGQYIWEQVKKVYREGITFDQSEVKVPHNRNGIIQDFYYNIAYRPLKENEKIVGMIQVAIDVTEQVVSRKKLELSESRFRNVIDKNPIGTAILTGPEMKIEIANDVIIKYWNRDNSIINKPLLDAIPELAGQPFPDLLANVYNTGVTHTDNEALAYFVNAEQKLMPVYFSYSYTALRDADGTIYGVLIMAVDVTENVLARKKIEESELRYKELSESLEQQVNSRTSELTRSNDDLEQFAHVASHDLKEPVRKIKTFTYMLEDYIKDKLDETATRFIERIHVATNRMVSMIDGVLTYSSINASVQVPELVDLNSILENIKTDLEVLLQKTGGTIHFNNLPELEGAPVLMYQLFYNLINNSLKFVKPGVAPQVTISSETMGGNKTDYVRITVSDNGIGFDPDYAEQIFETFTRLNSKDKYEGTGLGLSLCKKIVERHGGSIVASGAESGAMFIITLPLRQVENAIL